MPTEIITPTDEQHWLSLSDYFAAKAMQMLRSDLNAKWIAERAYEMADAMLKARDQ